MNNGNKSPVATSRRRPCRDIYEPFWGTPGHGTNSTVKIGTYKI